MSLLFETIRLENGELQNMEFHNSRMNKSRQAFFGSTDFIDLRQVIQVPDDIGQGIYKVKVIYSQAAEEVIFAPYIPGKIESLRLVADEQIVYSSKFTDRSQLDKLFQERGLYDDILIVKAGNITDTSFSNIVFYDGSRWITPATPLLEGTMRNYLLTNKLISEKTIRVHDLHHFQKARLINAMLPLATGTDIRIEKISF